VAKAVYDPNSSRLSGNYYASPDAGTCVIDGVNYQFQKTLDLGTVGVPASSYGAQNGLQFLAARFLYNSDVDQSVGFSLDFAGNGVIPAQGSTIDSTGTLNTSTRRIVVSNLYSGYPPILDNAIFSPSGVVK
jgi:hypothetical protein